MKWTILFAAMCLGFEIYGQEQMTKHKINDEISFEIPESFPIMSKSDRFQKVVSVKEPLAMYTSEDGEVTFGVNWNRMPWMAGDEETLYGFYKASIESMFDEVEFFQDEIKDLNGRKYIVFEFLGTLRSDNEFSKKTSKNYTYIQYTSYNNQVLLFNFGCKAYFMPRWKPVAEDIMKSIQINEKS